MAAKFWQWLALSFFPWLRDVMLGREVTVITAFYHDLQQIVQSNQTSFVVMTPIDTVRLRTHLESPALLRSLVSWLGIVPTQDKHRCVVLVHFCPKSQTSPPHIKEFLIFNPEDGLYLSEAVKAEIQHRITKLWEDSTETHGLVYKVPA